MMNENLLKALQWRYAVKKFDTDKKIDEVTLSHILEMANLTATSLGIQGYKLVVIEDDDWKEKLKSASFNQENLQTCSHLLVMCSRNDVDKTYVNDYVKYMEKVRGLEDGTMKAYEDMCNGFVDSMDAEKKKEWLANQVYIVMGNLLTSCALLGIDTCPMEGFNPKLVDEILDLEKHGLHSVLLLPLGYRAEDDKYAMMQKVRRPINEMVVKL